MAFHPNDNMSQFESQLKDLYGICVDNKDPLQLCRIRCKVEGLLETDDISTLPWCRPKNKGQSGRLDYGTFNVPELYSKVKVHFPDGDICNPEYEAAGDDATDTSQTRLFGEDYPNTEGTCNATGTWTRVNKQQKYEEHLHTSGFYAQVDKDGNFHLFVPKSFIIHVGENFYLNSEANVGIKVGQNIGVIAGDAVGIKANSTMELLANTGTWEATGGIDLNSGVTFGTADSIGSNVTEAVKTVGERQGVVTKLQQSILKAGIAAVASLQATASALLGTRTK